MFEYLKLGEMMSEINVGSQLWVSMYAKNLKPVYRVLLNKQCYNLSMVCNCSIFRIKQLKKCLYKNYYFLSLLVWLQKILYAQGKKTKTENISHLRNDSGHMIATAESQWS